VELKPKCGLKERYGLPSRFRMLQVQKLREGKIRAVSDYNPIDLLSQDPERTLRALRAALAEPQNNLRVFDDGEPVLMEELLASRGRPACLVELERRLRKGGLWSLEALLRLLAGSLAGGALPLHLRRAQAWAAGEAAPLAERLLEQLQARAGDWRELLQDPGSFARAVEGSGGLPADESGIELAVSGMDAALDRCASEPWSEELQAEVVSWLCRFLLGRTFHDVSLLVNFVRVPVTDAGEVDVGTTLTLGRLGFEPLSLGASPLPWSGVFVRSTVVDTDMKSPGKIPAYARELDEECAAWGRRHGSPAPTEGVGAMQEAVGGHEASIRFEGAVVWKRLQEGERAKTELDFYARASGHSFLPRFVPVFHGQRTADGASWLGMGNSLHGLQEPAVLDLKMGTQRAISESKVGAPPLVSFGRLHEFLQESLAICDQLRRKHEELQQVRMRAVAGLAEARAAAVGTSSPTAHAS